MAKGDDGVWSVTVGPLPPGIYDYTFNVDGVSHHRPVQPERLRQPPGQPRLRRGARARRASRGTTSGGDVPHGTVTIHWYDSDASGRRRRVHVYTPPGYGKDRRASIPVLYLLHGSGDNDSHWMHIGRANVIADNLIADGKAVPMLIVMPDGHVATTGDRTARVRDRPAGRTSCRWSNPPTASDRRARSGRSPACRWAAGSRWPWAWGTPTSSPGSGRSAAPSRDGPPAFGLKADPARIERPVQAALARDRQGRLCCKAKREFVGEAEGDEGQARVQGDAGGASLGRLAAVPGRVLAATVQGQPLA